MADSVGSARVSILYQVLHVICKPDITLYRLSLSIRNLVSQSDPTVKDLKLGYVWLFILSI